MGECPPETPYVLGQVGGNTVKRHHRRTHNQPNHEYIRGVLHTCRNTLDERLEAKNNQLPKPGP